MSTIQHTVREKVLSALGEMTQGELTKVIQALQFLIEIVSNFQVTQNTGPIAPSGSISWDSNPFTFFGENVLVLAGISVETQAADQAVQYALVKDSLTTLVSSEADVSTKKFGQSVLAWIDQGNAGGSTHTFSITATNSTGGQTVTVPAAGQAWILLIELP